MLDFVSSMNHPEAAPLPGIPSPQVTTRTPKSSLSKVEGNYALPTWAEQMLQTGLQLSKRKAAAQMWFPKQNKMDKLQMATGEKLQPCGDTCTVAEGALLEADLGVGPRCLENSEKVISRKKETQNWD